MTEEKRIELLRERIVRALKNAGLEVEIDWMRNKNGVGIILDVMDDEYSIRFVEEMPNEDSFDENEMEDEDETADDMMDVIAKYRNFATERRHNNG